MRQPKWETPIGDLRAFLQFAVPLRAAGLAYDLRGHSPDEACLFLVGKTRDGGVRFSHNADAVLFSDGRPRAGSSRNRVIRTVDDLVAGVAAAALLAQLDGRDGVWFLGDWYGTRQTPADGGELQCSERDCAEEFNRLVNDLAAVELADPTCTAPDADHPKPFPPPPAPPPPRPVVDVHLPDPEAA